jgi:hypothetical protein
MAGKETKNIEFEFLIAVVIKSYIRILGYNAVHSVEINEGFCGLYRHDLTPTH